MKKTQSEDNDDGTLTEIISKISNYVNTNQEFKSFKTQVEITELKQYASVVFMKVCDSTKMTIVKAIIYNANYYATLVPGNKIDIKCELKFYKNELELIIKSYTLVGEGNHIKALIKLKTELEKEGYFKDKKEIKTNYNKIGVISSLNAAGLKDFVHTISSRCSGKKIYLYPATVQGPNAPSEISSAIKLANKHNLAQVLVIIRGGGSKDDLECFNDREIAKAIYRSKLPIATGIGHQIDVSIADMTADKNFITPTATAQAITTENLLTKGKLRTKIKEIRSLFQLKFNAYYTYITNSEARLQKHKDTYVSNFHNILYKHLGKKLETKNRIKLLSEMKHNYIAESENKLIDIKNNFTREYSDIIISHKNKLNITNMSIKEKIAEFDSELSILAKPKITCGDEEIHTLKKFKASGSYRINFIDGYYDIKIKK